MRGARSFHVTPIIEGTKALVIYSNNFFFNINNRLLALRVIVYIYVCMYVCMYGMPINCVGYKIQYHNSIGTFTVFVHLQYLYIYSIGTVTVLVHLQYLYIYSIGTFTVLVHLQYWYIYSICTHVNDGLYIGFTARFRRGAAMLQLCYLQERE